MKTICITGGAGFIGSTLSESYLNDGINIICVDNFNDYYDVSLKEENIRPFLNNPNYQLFRTDIRDYDGLNDIFNSNKIDCIVHLAARAGVRPSLEDPILYQEVNGRGTQNILEMARIYNIKKLVLASSSSVYGNNDSVPFKETDIVDYAISPYAATKKANEVMGHVYHKLYGIDLAFLRFFTVYGPKQRPDLAINKFMTKILNDEPIDVYGDGSSSRDYTYIDDIVNGIKLSMNYVEENRTYEIFNIGSNSPVSLKEMISTIENAVGKKAVINNMSMQPGDVNRTYADISKLSKYTGYKPSISFKDGIEKFYEWKLK